MPPYRNRTIVLFCATTRILTTLGFCPKYLISCPFCPPLARCPSDSSHLTQHPPSSRTSPAAATTAPTPQPILPAPSVAAGSETEEFLPEKERQFGRGALHPPCRLARYLSPPHSRAHIIASRARGRLCFSAPSAFSAVNYSSFLSPSSAPSVILRRSPLLSSLQGRGPKTLNVPPSLTQWQGRRCAHPPNLLDFPRSESHHSFV